MMVVGSSGAILSHITSGMQYEISTPVNSDINTSQKKVQYSLAFSIKRSMLITQQSSTTFRIGSKWDDPQLAELNP